MSPASVGRVLPTDASPLLENAGDMFCAQTPDAAGRDSVRAGGWPIGYHIGKCPLVRTDCTKPTAPSAVGDSNRRVHLLRRDVLPFRRRPLGSALTEHYPTVFTAEHGEIAEKREGWRLRWAKLLTHWRNGRASDSVTASFPTLLCALGVLCGMNDPVGWSVGFSRGGLESPYPQRPCALDTSACPRPTSSGLRMAPIIRGVTEFYAWRPCL